MKKHYITAMIMGLAIAAQCAMGITAEAKDKQSDSRPMEKHKIIERLYENEYVSSLMILSDGVSEESRVADVPKYYDLRQEGLVTPVKDQGNYGTCWSFAAMNSIETSLVEKEPYIDLSEWMLTYYTYCKQFGYPLEDEEASIFDQGGTYDYSSAMLAAGIGAFNEQFKKWYYGDESILKDKSSVDDVRDMRNYQVTDIEYFSYWQDDEEVFPSQIHAIQNAVYNGHALALSYTHFDNCYYAAKSSYYTPSEFLNSTDNLPFHSVSIVGWDDNYSAENFRNIPEMDGAWLCKNSWGESWGDGGYFWLSYADASIYDIFYLDAQPVQKYSDIHVYDNYGFTNFISSDGNTGTKSDYMANIFKADEDCTVTAAMISTVNPDEEYEITVYKGLTDLSDPCSGTPNDTISGVISNTGYHTIDLKDPVYVNAGESYSVVVKLSGEMGFHIACEGYIDKEVFYKDGTSEYFADNIGKRISKGFEKGQSFISSDGISWSDNYENGLYKYELANEIADESDVIKYVYYETILNNSIKVFTKPADEVVFSEYSSQLPIGTKIILTAPDGGTIKYSINGGEYKTYTKPIVFDGDMHISAYTNENKVYDQSYVQQKAVLSNVLVRNGDESEYIYESSKNSGEYIGYLWSGEKSVDIQLVSTGDISVNGKDIVSGEYYTVSIKDKNNIINIEVSENGKLSSQYTINFVKIEPIIGDVKIDGVINIEDAIETLRIYSANASAVTRYKFKKQQYLNSDVNADKKINIEDASLILKYYAERAAGLI